MGSGHGSETGRGTPGKVGAWHVISCHGGRLLWGKREDSRQDQEDGSGQLRKDGHHEVDWNRHRRYPEEAHVKSRATLPSPSVQRALRSRRSRRGSSSCPERAKSHGRRRSRLGHQPGRSRSGEDGRRARSTEVTDAPREDPTQGGGGVRQQWVQERKVQRIQGQEEKEEEKEERKEEERGGRERDRVAGWKAPKEGINKEVESRIWGNGPGPQRQDTKAGTEKSPAVPRKEKVEESLDRHHRGGQHGGRRRDRSPHGPDRSVHGRKQDTERGGTLSRSLDPGDGWLDEAGPLDASRRRERGSGGATGVPPVLQEHHGPENVRSGQPGSVEHSNSSRLHPSRTHCPSSGLPVAEVEVPRGNSNGHLLGHSSEARTTSGDGILGWQGGDDQRQERRLRGVEEQVALERGGSPERRWKEQDQRQERQEQLAERRQEARGERPTERKRQEVTGEEAVMAAPDQESRVDKKNISGKTPEKSGGAATPEAAGGAVQRIGTGAKPSPSEVQQVNDDPVSKLGGREPEAPLLGATSPTGDNDQGILKNPGHDIFSETFDSSVRSWKKDPSDLLGKRLHEMGPRILQWLLEVSSLRGKPTGKVRESDLFPLPTSREKLGELFPSLSDLDLSWLVGICISLNSVWGEETFSERPISDVAAHCLKILTNDVLRVGGLVGRLEDFDWKEFFETRSIDYKGDEIRTAKAFSWSNISPALPKEIGRVPLSEVCAHGSKFYVENFDLYIKPKDKWDLKRAPRVMVSDADWPAVCSGLVACGLCTFLEADDVFDTGSGLLLNGMFGVSKDEWDGEHEIMRLIMNLVPLNGIASPMQGDVETLPMWSLMSPFFLQPSENLLISSEDVRCFFYTMAVPPAWTKYLAFNKQVPDSCLPDELRGRQVFLAATVLPMGFANSVSLAQHVRRNLALWSGKMQPDGEEETNRPEHEIRKDKSTTIGNPNWRIYLDNYDLLERVEATGVASLEGSVAPSVMSLRQEYERWEVPRNLKKAVARQTNAEIQGAQVDGELGVAYPRESKLLKYVGAAMSLLSHDRVSQRQMQVVCGGLVYFSMFRRQLLGCLNGVWAFIESFNQSTSRALPLPKNCRLEIICFLALLPLARVDFRLDFHEQVSCSDASTTGGGICCSAGLSKLGAQVSGGKLRGELPESRTGHRILTMGLFDGISALRVATDLLNLDVLAHISVERDASARRVVEAHFPEVVHIEDVELVTEDMVKEWSMRFSQVSIVLLGSGPPCQGVSGLNAGRKGALRDARSCLFVHVSRITQLVRRGFPWAQVHSLIMDDHDRDHMSLSFGSPPVRIDAGGMTWCSRYYWCTWELVAKDVETQLNGVTTIHLQAQQDLDEVCKAGWTKVDPLKAYPTFATSRPRASAGHKPAGVQHCSLEELQRWQDDSFRFPPYQYKNQHCLVNKQNQLRLPDIEEREVMMGFPKGYTNPCFTKTLRKSQARQHLDQRLTLVGNSWSVPVVAWLLCQLFAPLGLCPARDAQQIMGLLKAGTQTFLQARLWRVPLRSVQETPSPENLDNPHKPAVQISQA